jgi:hypothetical protein
MTPANLAHSAPKCRGFPTFELCGGALASLRMPNCLVEIYVPRNAGLTEVVAAARAAARRSSATRRVRYVGSIVVPDDETCFHVFQGPSAVAAPFSGTGDFQVVDLLSSAAVDPASLGH